MVREHAGDAGNDARRHERPFAAEPRTEGEDLGGDRITSIVDAVDRRHLEHDPPSVSQPGHVHHHVDRRRDLRANVRDRQLDVGHQGHRLEPPQQMSGRVRVRRGQRPVVPGVHRLQHVERLTASDLADDDPVRPHPQRVANEVANRDLALALHIGRSRLETDDVGLAQAELGRVLDRDHAFAVGDERRQHAQQRRLSRARAAGDDHVRTPTNAGREEREHPRPHRAVGDELLRPERHHGKLPHVHHGTAERKGRYDRVHPRTVWQSRVHPR
jgi:hypothetical protein